MNRNFLLNRSYQETSLQVSILKDIPEGDFELGKVFLIKNNTDNDIELTIIPAGQSDAVTTIFSSGWNPELVRKVINAPSGLQYGY